MDCVLLAGGRISADDPLYAYTKGKPKALLDVGGRTMLERVVDALQDARSVDEIVVVGLGSGLGLTFSQPVHHISEQGNLLANALAGIRWAKARRPAAQRVMVCTSDIPALTGAAVDRYVAACQPLDRAAYYSFVTREALEARFPGSRRTFVRLKGLDVAGGDLVIGRIDIALNNDRLWGALIDARKHPLRIAAIVGPGAMVRLVLGRLSLEDVERTAGRIIGSPVKVMILDEPEIAMDADKPHQYDLLRAEFLPNPTAGH